MQDHIFLLIDTICQSIYGEMKPQREHSIKDRGGGGPESGFSKSQESFIRAEITAQLLLMKRQIDLEIAEDIKGVEERIKTHIASAEQRTTAAVAEVRSSVDTKVTAAKSQIVLANNNQLATVQEQTKQMMQAVGQQITNAAYKRVIADINRDIVPKVNSMVEFVNYQMQDPGEIVTDYRRAVHQQANEGQKLLTDGNDKHVISEHVSLFFREDN
jgi:hypothetical protein